MSPTAQALGDEVALDIFVSTSSSSARVTVSATITERPDFSCSRVERTVTVEVAASPPAADDHSHHVDLPRFGCASLQSVFDTGTETTAMRPPAVPVLVGSAAHQHGVEVIYNFE